ncbi:MAG TPA: outer membrane lipid asymmetry maintenance protein MlaD [Dissulfurispiraceae bacterium]|nr:outer membrane lipid asymmetry maintenance protein MlaD [Dissulfurispiraceae bacterium]
MQKKFDLELAVGIFVLIGFLALGYLSIRLGKLEVVGKGGYTLYAEFANAGGIKPGAVVEIAGVEIGKVKSIRLDNYSALATMRIYQGVKIQDDAIASIKTKGLVGEKFVQVAPGGSDVYLADGGRIKETESALDIEELVSKYVFGKV